MFWLAVERYLPACSALVILAVAIIFRASIAQYFVCHGLNMDGLYNAVFGWSAIQTGFVFAVYGFVMSSEGGFIERVRETTPMLQFLRYTRNATYLGFMLTFFSMPLMVSGIKVSRDFSEYAVIAAWFALFIWAFLSFGRVAYLFGILLRPKAKPLLPG